MEDLDRKLEEILLSMEWCHAVKTDSLRATMPKIKQAFKEAGWVEPQTLEYQVVYRPSPKLNPEWMVKNNIDYDTITDPTILPPRAEYEAAKKAAGLES